jgi:hypothetical protein
MSLSRARNQFNRIVFSQLKYYIKKEGLNTYEDINRVIKNILEKKITKEHFGVIISIQRFAL